MSKILHNRLVLRTLSRPIQGALLFAVALSALACASTPSAEFTASSTGGSVPVEVTFTPSESGDASFFWEFGDGQTSEENSPTHTFQDAGELVVRLTVTRGGNSSFTEERLHLEPGEAGWITVEPATLVLQSGERAQFDAFAFDKLGNPVDDAGFTWSADESAGTVLEDGTFVAGPLVGTHSQAVTVEFQRGGVTASLDIPVEIKYGELESVSVVPPTINLPANGRVELDVFARDKQGHVIPDVEIEWKPLRPGVDTVVAGGEFRAGALPTDQEQELLEVRASMGSRFVTTTVTGRIDPGILDRVDVSVDGETSVGSETRLSATGYDRFGNLVELDFVEWEVVDPEYGVVSVDGVFTPSGAAVTATGPLVLAIGELNRVKSYGEIELDVLPGPAVDVILSPAGDSLPVGSSSPFAALVVDEYGNVINGVEVEWSIAAGGVISEDGMFTAGFETGEYLAAITATVPAGAYGNPSSISSTTDVVVRDRSSDMLAIEVSSSSDSGIILFDLVNVTVKPLSEDLENDDGVELSPSWWPDGRRLAYSSDVSGTMQIYDVEIETGVVRQLVDVEDGSAMPAISPDGTQIAFVVTTGSDWQLFVADLPEPDAEGNVFPITLDDATKLSADDELQSLLPFWSPDGSKILYTVSRTISDVDMMVVSADGSTDPIKLGRTGLSGFGWSTSGESVLAVDNKNPLSQSLVIVDSATGEVSGSITLPFRAFMAAWSPDSTEAVVIDRALGALWLVDTDGSSLRQSISAGFVPRRVAWRPVPIDAAAVLAAIAEAESTASAP